MEGFNVYEGVEIENIDEVRQVKNVLPVTSGVKLSISKVKPEVSKDGDTKSLALSFKLVEGIIVEGETKYQNAMATQFPQRVIYWVNPTKVEQKSSNMGAKESSRNWWKNKQYLVEFKQLLISCGIDPKLTDYRMDDGKLNLDSLISAIQGKEILGDIRQREESAFDKNTGETKGLGTFQNEVKNFRRSQ